MTAEDHIDGILMGEIEVRKYSDDDWVLLNGEYIPAYWLTRHIGDNTEPRLTMRQVEHIERVMAKGDYDNGGEACPLCGESQASPKAMRRHLNGHEQVRNFFTSCMSERTAMKKLEERKSDCEVKFVEIQSSCAFFTEALLVSKDGYEKHQAAAVRLLGLGIRRVRVTNKPAAEMEAPKK